MSSSTIRPNVLKLCQDDQRCADSDPWLLATYWEKYDGWDESRSLYDNLEYVTPPESITRARRKLHELGQIKYLDDVDKARDERFIEERDDNSEYEAVSWMND